MMKHYKTKKILLSGFMCLVLMFSLSVPTFAQPSTPSEITFGNKFVFEPGTNDMFTNFKRLLPGETRTQEIKISNISADSAKFFLTLAVAEQDKTLTKEQQDLVWDLIYNRIQITVTDNNNKVLYIGSLGGDKNTSKVPNESTHETISLGELNSKTSQTLTIKLKMDDSIDNKYQGLAGNVNWIFIAEQNGKSSDISIGDNNVPLGGKPGGINGNGSGLGNIINTNDPSSIAFWSIILAVSAVLITVVIIAKKKKKQINE